ncbi:MAG TPA: DUF362 domain-containing protein [Kofleriaceae bacterium]|jgi:intein/homing endonuclease
MARSKVAVVRVRPDTVLEDIDRLYTLGEVEKALAPDAPTILKDNISWHFPFPGANTTPWQLEGTVRSLKARGYEDQVCVQNKTVVTDAFKGEDLNGYVPIFKKYNIPVRYNFKPEDMTWSVYRPKAKMLVLDTIFPEGIQIPDAFHDTNIVQLPTVKCVAGETEVILGDGTLTSIAELVQMKLAAGEVIREADGTEHAGGEAMVFAMAPDGAIRPMKATRFARTTRGGRRVVRVRMKSGREIVATEDHPLFAASGWTHAGMLEIGDRVAVARRVAATGVAQALPQTHSAKRLTHVVARAGRTYSAEQAQSFLDRYVEGETVTAIAAGAGVRWQSVQSILKRHAVPMRRNVIQMTVPLATSPAFWRWMGYVAAEGCTETLEQGAGKLWWTNTDAALRDDFVSLTEELFGLDARVRNHAQISIYSRDLVRFLGELGCANPLNSGNKSVPRLLYRCSTAEIASFLSAYLDGDGTVSNKQAEVSATTKSQQLATDLVALFSRLGVVAFVKPVLSTIPGVWEEPRTYYQVTVSGAAVAVLAQHLRLRHSVKAERLSGHVARLATSKQPSNWDTVPACSSLVASIRAKLRMTQAATGLAGSVNNIENAYSNPTPRIVRALVESFGAADSSDATSEERAALARLAHEDLAWDHVETIEDVDGDLPLYDITVPEGASFVASGIVAHNCHIYTTTTGAMKNAFGGLLNTKRHYTHSWIHETLVDLLAIQKEIHSGLFAMMDGTTAGDGPGPRTMRPVIKDVMLASEDQVAIDAVAASMMGFDPMSLKYIKLADEAGLGNGRRENIEVVGDVELADQRWGFSVGDNGASMVGDLMWFGPLKRFQKLFFHTPLVNLFVAGSEAYHDYYRWPLRDRKIFEQWRETTHWGQLFDYYQANGTLAQPADIKAAQR